MRYTRYEWLKGVSSQMVSRSEHDPFAPPDEEEPHVADEDAKFPSDRFRDAGATDDEITQLEDEWERSDASAKQSMADHYASLSTGALAEYLENLRSGAHFLAKEAEKVGEDVEHDVDAGVETAERDVNSLLGVDEPPVSSEPEASEPGVGGAPETAGSESGAALSDHDEADEDGADDDGGAVHY